MATCKQCAHYDACGGYIPTDYDEDIYTYCEDGDYDCIPDIEKRCGEFADISRVFYSSCGLDDLLFCLITRKHDEKIYRNIEACRVSDITFYSKKNVVYGVREVNTFRYHNVTLGKDAFKTFEEAEKILKEKEKEDE